MAVAQLSSTDAFVVSDLDDETPATGIVRAAPKVLRDGAGWLARSVTYQHASFERRVQGASAGINAPVADRAAAVSAFVAEVTPMVASGRLLLDPAKGVDPGALRWDEDPRPAPLREVLDDLTAAGIVAAAAALPGGLAGRRVAIEGFDASSPALVRRLADHGAPVVAVATAEGSATGLAVAPDVLVAAWHDHGPALVAELGVAAGPPPAVFGADADVVVCGSRAGVLDHTVAADVRAGTVVPAGPLPVTAKALAVLARAGTVVLPDFVTTAGASFARFSADPTAAPAVVEAEAAAAVAAVIGEVLDHEAGPLLGACLRAEAFLATWRDELPFGRPLA